MILLPHFAGCRGEFDQVSTSWKQQTRQNAYAALKTFHSPPVAFAFPFDNTGEGGTTYTKSTNIGLDILSTLAAVEERHETLENALSHVARVMDGLETLKTVGGIFPEYIKIEENGVFSDVQERKIRFSSIDSGWLHFALGVAAAYYRDTDSSLAARMEKQLDEADYSLFIGDEGRSFGHGFFADAESGEVLEWWPHNYDNINSEARVIVGFLAAARKIPETVWSNMLYRFVQRDGLPVAEGWNMSAFVEMIGNSYLPELELAPNTLGTSHRNYLNLCQKIAKENEFLVFGWAPCFGPEDRYTEYGLDRPDAATPYAAALLTTFNHPKAWENFKKMVKLVPSASPPRPLPDAFDSRSGKVVNERALALNHNLFYHALCKETVRRLVRRTSWYPRLARLFRQFDREHQKQSQQKNDSNQS